MKRRLTAFVLAACIALPLPVMVVGSMLIHGCATVEGDPAATNAARAFQARVAYNSALKAANARAPRMSLEQAEQFEKVRQSAKRLLTTWDEAVAAGRPFSGSDSLVTILAELALLVEENPQ